MSCGCGRGNGVPRVEKRIDRPKRCHELCGEVIGERERETARERERETARERERETEIRVREREPGQREREKV